MKKCSLFFVLVGSVCLSGCIATLSPQGGLSGGYIGHSVFVIDDGPKYHYHKAHYLPRPTMVYVAPKQPRKHFPKRPSAPKPPFHNSKHHK